MKNPTRNFLFTALAAAALAGCGKPPAPSATTSSEPSASPAAQASAPAPAGDTEKKLSIFCWSEYVPQSVIDQFTKETGIKVSVENYASNEEMLAKLLAGGGSYDLIQPSEYVIEGLIKENLLAPIDHAAASSLHSAAA